LKLPPRDAESATTASLAAAEAAIAAINKAVTLKPKRMVDPTQIEATATLRAVAAVKFAELAKEEAKFPEPRTEAQEEILEKKNEIARNAAMRAFHSEFPESSTGGDHAIHSEANAVTHAQVPLSSFKDSIAVVSLMPCPQCYKLLAHLQVKYIVTLSDYGRYIGSWKEASDLDNKPGPVIVPLSIIQHRILERLKDAYSAPGAEPPKWRKPLPNPQEWPDHFDRSTAVFKQSIPLLEKVPPNCPLVPTIPEHLDCDYKAITFHYPDIQSVSGDAVDELLDILLRTGSLQKASESHEVVVPE
jgi:tRNA(Arg) A34 adenosine deaminase TadA